jgi:hypothetical protein
MTEQYSEFSGFKSDEVRTVLAAQGQPARDLSHGAGEALSVAGGRVLLEVFPASGVARVTTDHARVEVHRVPGYSVDQDKGRVVFEQGPDDERTRLIVRGDGKVSFYPIVRAAEAAVTEQKPATDAKPTAAPQVPSEAATGPQTTSVDSRQESEEVQLVTLQGRLGRDPWFSGGEDSPIAGFPLAVNTDSQTTWHKVVVFDETAVALKEHAQRGDIRKGRLVDVTGHIETREEPTTKGTKKIVEFHASQVTRVRASRPR